MLIGCLGLDPSRCVSTSTKESDILLGSTPLSNKPMGINIGSNL